MILPRGTTTASRYYYSIVAQLLQEQAPTYLHKGWKANTSFPARACATTSRTPKIGISIAEAAMTKPSEMTMKDGRPSFATMCATPTMPTMAPSALNAIMAAA